MAQQFLENENQRPIKRAGAIRPKEDVTVYATEMIGNHKGIAYKTGDAFTVHRVLAEKLVAEKKATLEDPNAKTKKEDKK